MRRPPNLPRRAGKPADIDLADIQGNVLRGYTMPAAAYLFLRIVDDDKARALMARMLPQVATAFLAGGMLAFALSFDEIIVTIFTAGKERTLPIWFFNELFRPRDRPVTNVVAVIVICVTLIPIVLAYYLTRPDDEHETAR
jgi:hypothetical protein